MPKCSVWNEEEEEKSFQWSLGRLLIPIPFLSVVVLSPSSCPQQDILLCDQQFAKKYSRVDVSILVIIGRRLLTYINHKCKFQLSFSEKIVFKRYSLLNKDFLNKWQRKKAQSIFNTKHSASILLKCQSVTQL